MPGGSGHHMYRWNEARLKEDGGRGMMAIAIGLITAVCIHSSSSGGGGGGGDWGCKKIVDRQRELLEKLESLLR